MVLNVHRNHKAYQGRGEGGGKGVWRWGYREIIYLSLHCHHQNDFCIKVGSDESHFNVSLIVRDKGTRQCPQTTTFLKRKESRSNIEPRSFRLPAYRLTVRPNRLSNAWLNCCLQNFVVCGHCLVPLSLTINETLKRLS